MKNWGGLPRWTLETGGVKAQAQACVLSTVLGSCVSVCLYDLARAVGGMNHFLLPEGECEPGQEARFGVYAMEILINEVMRAGGQRPRLMAKVFGGGRVLGGVTVQDPGGKNAAFALAFLEQEAIPVTSQLLCLDRPLEVNFLPHTGQAFVKRLERMGANVISEQERRYRESLQQKAYGGGYGDVTLF